MSVHGGEKFETADIGSEQSKVCSEDERDEVAVELDTLCISDVQRTIDSIDGVAVEEAKEEEAEEDFDEEDGEEEEAPKKKKKKAKKRKMINVGVNVEQEELAEISELINNLTMAKTPKELKAAAMAIKEEASELTGDQKKYLSAYYKKRKTAIEDAE